MTGFAEAGDGSITAVETSEGPIEVGEQVVVAPGPWAARFWSLLGLPDTIDVRTPSGEVVRRPADVDVLEPPGGRDHGRPARCSRRPTAARRRSSTSTPTRRSTRTTAKLVTDELWGIYFKRDRHGVQGGASPLVVDGDVELDPYPSTTDVDPSFPDMWCAALSHSMSRFEGCRARYKTRARAASARFTVDNFPVFDYLRPNLYGDLRLEPRLQDDRRRKRGRRRSLVGEHSRLLYPFRFERFATGDLHPVSSSPYPWS